MSKDLWVQVPLSLMKLIREKSIRKTYVDSPLDAVANLICRGIIGEDKKTGPRKSYRNICQMTGRSRGLIRNFKYSRLVFRSLADSGKIEGIKRASW